MKPITIQMLHGVNAGRARAFEQSPIAFGRDPSNDVVVEVPLASRQHGELVFDEDQDRWLAINHSANGTTVNGKRVARKPIALKSGDTVGVGGEKMFEVEIAEPAPAPAAATPSESRPAEPDKPKMTGKNKLWIGLGIYFFAMMIVIFIALQLVDRSDGGGGAAVPELTSQQIAAEITRTISRPQNMREASVALETARQRYELVERDASALFEAYRNFKLAYAYSNGELFTDGLVFREYKKSEQELIDLVTRTYALGYAQIRSKQWSEAEQTLRKLLQIYPDNDSRIHRNVIRQLRLARSRGM